MSRDDHDILDGLEVLGLMPHNDRFPLLSRDWDEIDCKSVNCACCRDGKCIMPSRAKIGESGRCEGYLPKGTIKVKDEKPA